MMTWGRFLFSLVLLTASLAGASSHPNWLQAFGRPGDRQQLEEEIQRQAVIEWRGEVVRRRLAAKRMVARQLIEGQITLFQAAAHFGYLNSMPEDCPNPESSEFLGHSPGEKLCREVLGWAKKEVRPHWSAEAHSLIDQFEAELQAHLAANGGVVVLPED